MVRGLRGRRGLRLRWHKWPKSSLKWLLVGTNGASAQWMSRAGRVLRPGFSPTVGVQQRMPPRAPSADISLVYLPCNPRPQITEGSVVPQPGSHPSRPPAPQVFCWSLVGPLFVWRQITVDCKIKHQEARLLASRKAMG